MIRILLFLANAVLINGGKFAAIPEVLYLVRLEGVWQRRRGTRWFLSHYNLQKEFLAWKFVTLPTFVLNVAFRFFSLLIPVTLAGVIRKRLLKL